jgi:hypothetical protein
VKTMYPSPTTRLLTTGIAAAALVALTLPRGNAQTGGAQTTAHQRANPTTRTGTAGQAGTTATSGPIIGNKHTHVYHLASDTGSMPSAKNRVYFQTETEAQAAGYHAAKTGGRKSGTISKSSSHGHSLGAGQGSITGGRK